jgi:hypothetical protein
LSEQLQKLKAELAAHLCQASALQPPEGLTTGLTELDSYLNWRGLPLGELTLLRGALGLGATHLWLGAAAALAKQRKWSIWINDSAELFPLSLLRNGFDLSYLLHVSWKKGNLFFALKEILNAEVFTLVACNLDTSELKAHHLRKLSTLARKAKISLVFFQQPTQPGLRSQSQNMRIPLDLFSLVLDFSAERIAIERAKHHPTPHFIARRWSYACLMPEFAQAQFIDPRRSLSQIQSTRALSRAPTDLY